MQDMIDITQIIKQECKINQKIIEIMSILLPHQYMKSDSVYGENDMYKLILQKDYKKTWPEPKLCSLNQEPIETQTVQYYESLFSKMIRQYVTYATNKGDILAFNDVTNYTNTIDMVKMFKHNNKKVCDPDIEFDEEEINALRSRGWKAFLPCFNDMVIKVNRQRYFVVKLKNIDKKNKSYTIEFNDYAGNKCDWTRIISSTLTFNFGKENEDGLPLSWTKSHAESYETFLTKYVDQMNWSKRQINFWQDVLGVFNNDEQINIEMTILNDEESKNHMVVRDKKSISKLQQLLGDRAQISIIGRGETVTEGQRQYVATECLILYIKTIAKINYSIYYGEKQVTKSDNAFKTTIGDLVITSQKRLAGAQNNNTPL